MTTRLHLAGLGVEAAELPAVPSIGSYLRSGGRLWRVAAVVFEGADVEVYASVVSDALAADLQRQWAAWCDPAMASDPGPDQHVTLGA